jgi:hypothetical protein
METKGTVYSDIVHVMTNQNVRIVSYDKRTGQVSYTWKYSDNVYTCYDYELASVKGIDHLRDVLSTAAENR